MTLTRRHLVQAWALGLIVLPRTLHAQTAVKVHRVGILRPSAPPLSPTDPSAVGIPNALRDACHPARMLDHLDRTVDIDRQPARRQAWTVRRSRSRPQR